MGWLKDQTWITPSGKVVKRFAVKCIRRATKRSPAIYGLYDLKRNIPVLDYVGATPKSEMVEASRLHHLCGLYGLVRVGLARCPTRLESVRIGKDRGWFHTNATCVAFVVFFDVPERSDGLS